jgi:hypothetical protein
MISCRRRVTTPMSGCKAVLRAELGSDAPCWLSAQLHSWSHACRAVQRQGWNNQVIIMVVCKQLLTFSF